MPCIVAVVSAVSISKKRYVKEDPSALALLLVFQVGRRGMALVSAATSEVDPILELVQNDRGLLDDSRRKSVWHTWGTKS